MPLEHPDFLKNNPYYDDFSDDKNFLRVLFKPGFAIQARELTQLQTTLQSQISKFADHIFREGSKVFGGNVTSSKLEFIRLEKNRVESDGVTPIENSFIDSYLETLKKNTGTQFVSNNSDDSYVGSLEHIEFEVFKENGGVYNFGQPDGTVRLVHYLPAGFSENDDYTVLLVNSVSGSEMLLRNSVLKVKGLEIYAKITDDTTVAASGLANLVSVQEGIYYTNGSFVNNNRQHIVSYTVSDEGETEETLRNGVLFTGAKKDVRLFEYSSNRIGFTVVRRSVTVEEDISLRDPASGFYNANAPGADRYKIDLVLTSLPLDVLSVDIENFANKDFIQLVRITKGAVDWIQRLPNYSEILDLIARRTYDESGSYTVRPFTVEMKEHLRRDVFEIFVADSIDDTISPFYLQVGGYVWQDNGNVPVGFNPFDSNINLQNLSFPIGVIKNVIPFKESHQTDSSETGSISSSSNIFNKKILIQPVNPVRFSFTGNLQDLIYQKSASQFGNAQTINARFLGFQLDSEGTYSLYDFPSGDTNKAILSIQPGKAYVYGYEQDFYTTRKIEYLKGRDPNQDVASQNSFLSTSSFLGNYVVGNFIPKDLSLNTSEQINWETLPKFEFQSDDVFTLIMRSTTTEQARGTIAGWSPFDRFSQTTEARKMFGFTGPEEDQEYESVIAIIAS